MFPGSSREELVEEKELVKVYVKAPPDKGKANKALLKLLAAEYGVSKSRVRIVSGLTSRKKIVQIET